VTGCTGYDQMRNSAIRTLIAAARKPIVAAAFVEHTVQIWNWSTGEQLSEFDTVFQHGGHRLALNPGADSCVAASWKKSEMVWPATMPGPAKQSGIAPTCAASRVCASLHLVRPSGAAWKAGLSGAWMPEPV